jgi:CRISPR system Cascade subunit CasE
MYLSALTIDSSDRRGRTWLANPYRVHQRLLMAFPDGDAGRVLFRVDADRRPPRILVQSPSKPDWLRCFHDHPVLAHPPQSKELPLAFRPGQRLHFLLRSNPTVRRVFPDARSADPAKHSGKRIGVYGEDAQSNWLANKGEQAGFRVVASRVADCGFQFSRKADQEAPIRHLCVDFEGILEVTEPDRFLVALQAGIGSGKGFGFGLLSVAPG